MEFELSPSLVMRAHRRVFREKPAEAWELYSVGMISLAQTESKVFYESALFEQLWGEYEEECGVSFPIEIGVLEEGEELVGVVGD